MLSARLLPAFGSLPLDRITRTRVTRWFDGYSRTAPGGLAVFILVAQRRDGADIVVPAFDPPRGDGGVVHRPAQGEVRLCVPRERIEKRALAADAPDQFLVVVDRVQDHKPVAGRRLEIGPVGPELGEHARVVAHRHELWLVGPAGGRIDGVADPGRGGQRPGGPYSARKTRSRRRPGTCSRRDAARGAVPGRPDGRGRAYRARQYLSIGAALLAFRLA